MTFYQATKVFVINGQKYKSRYVNRIQYLNNFNYGYVNVIMNSGSSINLPTEDAFTKFLFESDWLEPVNML